MGLIIASDTSTDELIQKSESSSKAIEESFNDPLLKVKGGISPRTGNVYNFIRIKEIQKFVQEYQSNIPEVLVEVIAGYDYNDEFIEFYEKIMDKLESLIKVKEGNKMEAEKREMSCPDFYKDTFASQLLSLILKEEDSIHSHDPFWHELYRLLFKWVIHMRRTFSIDNIKFDNAVQTIKPLLLLISKKNLSLALVKTSLSQLEKEDEFDFSMFQHLIQYELLERIDLFHIFNQIKNDFYPLTDEIIKKDDNSISCRDLEIKYFGGNFNNDLLLKFILVMYDPQERMRSCFPKEKSMFSKKEGEAESLYQLATSLHHHHQQQEREKDCSLDKRFTPRQVDFFERINMHYVGVFVLRSIFNSNLKFIIETSSKLIILLKRLDRAGLLTKKPPREIIKLDIYGENFKFYRGWNRDEFIKLLNEKGEETSPIDHDRYLQFIANESSNLNK